MSRGPQVLSITYREGLTFIFESTALEPVAKLHEKGYRTRLVVFAPLGELFRPFWRRAWRKRKKEIADVYDGPFHIVPSPPGRLRACWDERKMFARWLRRHYPPDERFILHARGLRAAEIALAARRAFGNTRVVYHVMGLAPAETKSGEDEPSDPTLVSLERTVVHDAEALVCVSEGMQRHIVDTHDVPSEKITVIPSCVAVDRFRGAAETGERVRRDLSLDDRFVVLFCGGFRWWQSPGLNARLFLLIKKSIPDAHFLVLTPSHAAMRDAMLREGVDEDDLTVRGVPHSDIPAHMAAADVALLLRQRSVVNEVASPVKFGEYLASGCPVMISPGIGDYSDLVASTGAGVVVDLESEGTRADAQASVATFLSGYRKAPDALRRRCIDLAEKELSWNAHLPKLETLYERLSS